MSPSTTTRFVVLTPPGRGAVASLLVEGPQAVDIVGELAHPVGIRLSQCPMNRIALARWLPTGEEVIVCRRGVELVEIHCHGGDAAVVAIRDALAEQGCCEVAWRNWTRESHGDPSIAAALVALAAAPTERTAAILWDQAQGAWRGAIEQLVERIQNGQQQAAIAQVERLLALAEMGRHLTEPWRIVLAGPPNVGKSSLINALVGFERTIVHSTPGTTRDLVTAASAIEGWPVELIDTAGMRATDDALELAGICLAEERMVTADLVVLVFDASDRRESDERSLAARWPGAMAIYNKCDLVPHGPLVLTDDALATSATQGVGIDRLLRTMAQRLVPVVPSSGEAVPLADDQRELLAQVREALLAGQSEAAMRLLSST